MPTVTSPDGAKIYYETRGTGATVLMFLHGWGGDGKTWNDVLPHIDPSRFRAVCVDLRGHGRSGRLDGGYSWESFRQDVIAVADQEKAIRFVPVGFSMGGKLACHLAAWYPERIPAQILVAPTPPGTVPIDRVAGLQFCREANDPQKVKSHFGPWFGRAARQDIVASCCKTIARTHCSVLEATAEMTLWTSIESIVGRLILPTLLVLGREDPVYGETFQREKMLPFLTCPKMAAVDSGHFIPLECPTEAAERITGFVEKL